MNSHFRESEWQPRLVEKHNRKRYETIAMRKDFNGRKTALHLRFKLCAFSRHPLANKQRENAKVLMV